LRIDYALVGLVLGKEMLGIYFVIRGMLEGVLGFLIQPVQTVLYAHYCDTNNSNGKHLFDRFAISYWITLIFASIVAWFVASGLFEYLLGSEYRIGASVMPGLVFYAGTVLWFENIKVISMAMNIHHELLYARVAQLIMFLAIFYPLIASAGITGAGLATALAGLALAFTATKLFVNKAEKVEV
jgi:O-antigen/teichoic acid export membrane protein